MEMGRVCEPTNGHEVTSAQAGLEEVWWGATFGSFWGGGVVLD